ncbi:Transducin/WD40 repeat-like superfamily protein [Striga hermonthica]|uniref:Transducin/WD40 repeat-like superfamily protein n=1 Tax=Striga hermonthica TaxID=68872 RepID=A0A9N7NL88_STRHE|nr:Transducin/WD40 repeat-like superfamily protein [Striga hermonthica]
MWLRNQVHLIRLSSGGTELICEGLFSHPNEIWDLASCPFDPRIFSTVYSSGETYGAAVWQILELYGKLSSPQLESVASLDAHTCRIRSVLWWKTGRHDKLVSIDEQNLVLWSLDTSKLTAQVQSKESAGMHHNLSGGAWDPYDFNNVSLTCDSSVQLWDLRTMKKTDSIEHAYSRNVDIDTKKRYMLKVEVSSCRSSCAFTLTAGIDSAVNLWLASLPSNDGSASDSLVESPAKAIKQLLHSYNDYEDGVYSELSDLIHLPTLCSSVAEPTMICFVQVLLGVIVNHEYLLRCLMMEVWLWNQ